MIHKKVTRAKKTENFYVNTILSNHDYLVLDTHCAVEGKPLMPFVLHKYPLRLEVHVHSPEYDYPNC